MYDSLSLRRIQFSALFICKRKTNAGRDNVVNQSLKQVTKKGLGKYFPYKNAYFLSFMRFIGAL